MRDGKGNVYRQLQVQRLKTVDRFRAMYGETRPWRVIERLMDLDESKIAALPHQLGPLGQKAGADMAKMRFGASPYTRVHTYTEIGRKYQVSRQRAEQLVKTVIKMTLEKAM